MRKFTFFLVFFALLSICQVCAQGAGTESQGANVSGNPGGMSDDVFRSTLTAFLAVAKDNVSSCDQDDSFCIDETKELLDARHIGELRCETITDPKRQNDCEKIKSKDCAALSSDGDREVCNGVLSGDTAFIPGAALRANDSVERVAARFGVLAGYQAKNYDACNKYVKKYVSFESIYSHVCDIVFSFDSERSFQAINNDFELYVYAKSNNAANSCGQIRSLYLMQRCYSFFPKSTANKASE